jgi:histidine triad (HIT) family protein
MKTLFEKIISGEIPGEIVYQNESLFVIKDKYPKAPVHLLIIPRKVVPNLQSLLSEDLVLVQEIVRVAQILATQFDLEEDGYRLLVNNGPDAGQTIEHLHFHLLGGHPLGSMG